ncbi:MAG: hypothetical protein AB1413_02125 [Thermodesulfobacteriota bacterium]
MNGWPMEVVPVLATLWQGVGWPLLRLIVLVSVGLLVGNFIEALNWTHAMARLASPLVRFGHLSDTAGASFSMAFFSGVAGNTMLAEAYDQGRMSRRELVLANLFNSMPTYFLHLPTMFFVTVPLIKGTALVYVGLTLLAAVLRTGLVLVIGRLLLPAPAEGCVTCRLDSARTRDWREALNRTWSRFRQRIRRILRITIPVYLAFFLLGRFGFFRWLEAGLAGRVDGLGWFRPEAWGIVVFQLAAEFTAGLAAAGALLETGALAPREIVLALLAGNVLSSPVRGIRHQFPFYAGIFNPRLAGELILCSQGFRAASLILVAVGYALLTS